MVTRLEVRSARARQLVEERGRGLLQRAFSRVFGHLLNADPNFDFDASIALAMGCSCASFPQTCLGLPLAPIKPLTNAFNPLVERSRKLLTGW